MTTQPEALRLAGELEDAGKPTFITDAAAVELRRLYAENVALRQTIAQAEQAQPEIVMAEYKFQPYAAYTIDGEIKIGVVPEQAQPVAWMVQYKDRHEFVWSEPKFLGDKAFVVPLYTIPPKREWVGLTEDEVLKCFDSVALGAVEKENVIDKRVNIFNAVKAIEAKIKEKNT